jgi:hypothetical protein
MSELCPTVAEVQDSTEASHAFACRKRPSHSEGHEPPSWANRMLLEPERLRWTATDPARATAIREGPFFVREFDADDTLVETLEGPTRREAVRMAYARAARMPTSTGSAGRRSAVAHPSSASIPRARVTAAPSTPE